MEKNIKWKLLVGLGNDDPRYEGTCHNAGFFALDFIRKTLWETGTLNRARWLKPHSFMNRSGGPVAAAMKKHRVAPSELLVIHDDSDLPLGSYKFSFGRGSAGHKGVQNIIDTLGTKAFWRLRIGIRPRTQTPADYTQIDAEKIPRLSASSQRGSARRVKAGDFVLKKMTRAHLALVEKALEQVLKDPKFAAASAAD